MVEHLKNMVRDFHRIGIMGGRLSYSATNKIQSFPKTSWKREFEKAEKCGFELIEWVFDAYDNPILDSQQLKIIKSLSERYHVKINSICADYFMENGLFGISSTMIEKNLKVLADLISKCNQLEIQMLEIPLVDSSSLKTLIHKQQFANNIQKILNVAEKNNVIINLETDLPPLQFRDFINSFNSRNVRANYDVGNSTALGYDVEEELQILGNLITNIHIKDRLIYGSTVPLGTGDVNFELFFKSIKTIEYKGDFIIQAARGNEKIIPPEETCNDYFQFIKQYVNRYLT